ncbi:MAG: hypothetical protein E6J75_07930 [Deltaproteobacteria bacterium]|nr:MAG: hypothetical protein E6J75_07930 [Deltaproteobacteria bacterium]
MTSPRRLCRSGTHPAPAAAVGRALVSPAIFLCVMCCGISVAGASVVVPMSDADLVRTSHLIVVGDVRRIETRELRDGRLLTEVALAVEQTLKGRLRGGKIVVTSPGGRVGERSAWVYGSPSFATGERVLVFLKRTAEGRLRINALALGKYHLDAASVAVPLARRTEPRLDARRLGPFVARLRALAAPEAQETIPSGRAASLRDEVVGRGVTERFQFLGNPPVRWFDAAVTFRVANAEPALGAATTQGVVGGALGAWTNVASASIVLGTGPATAPAHSVASGVCDGVNTIQFDDPFGEVNDMVGCSGVLAVGGFCSSGEQQTVNGMTVHRIVEGDVTVNNRVGSCFGATNTAEILTHEIGHAIGLAHPSQNFNEPNPVLKDATMFFVAHFDGRGASVHADDVAGVSALYPAAAAAADADGDGIPDASDRCPGTPAGAAVGGDGCACADAGHASCDDGNACTSDACDARTAACVHAAVSCSDGDPCTVDGCNAATGCFHGPPTGSTWSTAAPPRPAVTPSMSPAAPAARPDTCRATTAMRAPTMPATRPRRRASTRRGTAATAIRAPPIAAIRGAAAGTPPSPTPTATGSATRSTRVRGSPTPTRPTRTGTASATPASAATRAPAAASPRSARHAAAARWSGGRWRRRSTATACRRRSSTAPTATRRATSIGSPASVRSACSCVSTTGTRASRPPTAPPSPTRWTVSRESRTSAPRRSRSSSRPVAKEPAVGSSRSGRTPRRAPCSRSSGSSATRHTDPPGTPRVRRVSCLRIGLSGP